MSKFILNFVICFLLFSHNIQAGNSPSAAKLESKSFIDIESKQAIERQREEEQREKDIEATRIILKQYFIDRLAVQIETILEQDNFYSIRYTEPLGELFSKFKKKICSLDLFKMFFENNNSEFALDMIITTQFKIRDGLSKIGSIKFTLALLLDFER